MKQTFAIRVRQVSRSGATLRPHFRPAFTGEPTAGVLFLSRRAGRAGGDGPKLEMNAAADWKKRGGKTVGLIYPTAGEDFVLRQLSSVEEKALTTEAQRALR